MLMMFMLMEDDFFFIFCQLGRLMSRYSFSEDDVIYGDIVMPLLYTDFTYISTVFLMFTPCFSMFDIVLSQVSSWLIMLRHCDTSGGVMVARFIMLFPI